MFSDGTGRGFGAVGRRMDRRGVGGIGGPREEVGTRRDVLDCVWVFCVVERTQLVNDGRGWVRVATPVESEMS